MRTLGFGLLLLALAGCGKKLPPAPATQPQPKDPDTVWRPPAARPTVATESEKPPAAKTDLTDIKPDLVLDAETFADEMGTLPYPKRDEKYKGKVVELTGMIKTMGWLSADKASYIGLHGRENRTALCKTRDPEPWQKWSPEQKVRIRGNFAPGSFLPALKDCIVASSEPPPIFPTVSADELETAYAADPAAVTKKYDKQHVVVTGEVAELRSDSVHVWVNMRTGGKVQVQCRFGNFPKGAPTLPKAGDRVRLIGIYLGGSLKDLLIGQCVPAPKP